MLIGDSITKRYFSEFKRIVVGNYAKSWHVAVSRPTTSKCFGDPALVNEFESLFASDAYIIHLNNGLVKEIAENSVNAAKYRQLAKTSKTTYSNVSPIRYDKKEDVVAFMLKIQWNIKAGREDDFRENQQALCEVMLEHPGVICYHVDYPSESVSQWTEIYATDEAFAAHLGNEKGKGPLGMLVDACEKIICQCWGNPSSASREILVGFGTTYHETGKNAFVLNPKADRDSKV